ncbi:MAG: S46 family peptidase, partial [Planctomycetota bacterium]
MKKRHCLTIVTLVLVLIFVSGCQSGGLKNRKAFENPGGMWMPHQLAEQGDLLRSLGVDEPAALSDPLAYPLGAIVWLGGCSASFVSPDGLIVTNHHCAHSTLQFRSTPECNLYEEGFVARSRDEELPGEIGKKVWVTQEIVDVTQTIRDGLGDITNPLERHETIELRIKDLIAEHEKEDDIIRCSVKHYFQGQQYFLIKQLEIRDVRLVYAPKESVGSFGGFVDNWQWPRHTADFTFYRAYVAPDGTPAEYSPDNVPYKPKHYLRVADEPLEKHDFVMVAGYPGSTQRWQTARQIEFGYEVDTPRRIEVLTEIGEIYEQLAEQSEDLRIKVTPSIMGVTNYRQKLELTQDNIRDNDLIALKNVQQKELVDWVHADDERRQQWGPVLDEMDGIHETYQQTVYRDYLLMCVTRFIPLVNATHEIVRMAEERPKPDRERDPDFQERNWQRLKQGQHRRQKSYDPAIVKAVLAYYLDKMKTLPTE